MHTETPATVAGATVPTDANTLFASIELSKSKWLLTVNSPNGEKFSRHVVEGGDSQALLGLIARLRAKTQSRCGQQVARSDTLAIHASSASTGEPIGRARIVGFDRRRRLAKKLTTCH